MDPALSLTPEGFDPFHLYSALLTLYGVALKVCCLLSDKLEKGSVGQPWKLLWPEKAPEKAVWPPCLPLHFQQPQLQAWLVRPVGHSHWSAGWQEGPALQGWCLTWLPSDKGRSEVLTKLSSLRAVLLCPKLTIS